MALQRQVKTKQIPAVKDIQDPKVREILEALKENVEVLTGNKSRKTVYDKAVTLRELHQYGLANLIVNGKEIVNTDPDNSLVKAPVNQTVNQITEVNGTDLDLTPPATLTGLTAQATQTGVLVQFDDPNNSLYAYAEIWAAGVDNFTEASLIGTTDGFIYPDFIGASGVTRYYWVRPVSVNNVLGDFNAVSGVGATTGTAVDDNVLNSDSANFLNANIAHANIYSLNVSKLNSGTIRADRYIAVGKGTYGIIIDGQGNIRSGQTGYATGLNGFFMGQHDGQTKVSIGSGSNYVRFDGSNLLINTPDLVVNQGGATFSGTLTAASMIGGDINIGSGKFVVDNAGAVTINSGSYTGYVFPPAGGNGYHISYLGALWGSYYDGRYIQITRDGNIYTPGFQVENGVMTVHQANVIDTLNLRGNAVTVPASYNNAATTNFVSTTPISCGSFTTTNYGGKGHIQFSGEVMLSSGASGGDYATGKFYHNGVLVKTVKLVRSFDDSQGFGIYPEGYANFNIPIQVQTTAGVNTYEMIVEGPTAGSNGTIDGFSILVLETRR